MTSPLISRDYVDALRRFGRRVSNKLPGRSLKLTQDARFIEPTVTIPNRSGDGYSQYRIETTNELVGVPNCSLSWAHDGVYLSLDVSDIQAHDDGHVTALVHTATAREGRVTQYLLAEDDPPLVITFQPNDIVVPEEIYALLM